MSLTSVGIGDRLLAFRKSPAQHGAKMNVTTASLLRPVFASTSLGTQVTSQIDGTIRDSNGMAVPSAKVKAKQTAASAVRTTLRGRTELTYCRTFRSVRTCLKSPKWVSGNSRKPELMLSDLRDASEWVTRSSWLFWGAGLLCRSFWTTRWLGETPMYLARARPLLGGQPGKTH